MSVKEIESFFPIVFGHHAIAMGASIMYSPYAEQSIASALYVFFCFLLAIVNSKRLRKCTYGVWICKNLSHFSYGVFEYLHHDVSLARSRTVKLGFYQQRMLC